MATGENVAHDRSGEARGDRRLRLYIAGNSPNSARAQRNLAAALEEAADRLHDLDLEIIDVFSEPRRAIRDGVIVTPTLIAIWPAGRSVIMGDLTDTAQLSGLLANLDSVD
jgi:circadian clock protein KaiB